MAATSWITPISLLTSITETSTVSGRSAALSTSRSSRPSACTSSTLTSKPSRSSSRIVSSTALCSVFSVIRCRPRDWWKRAAPLIARLLDSVAPEVQTISRGSAPISEATCSRAISTASSAAQP